MASTIGIDVGGTNIRFGVFKEAQLMDEIRLEANLCKLCANLLPEHSSFEIMRILSSGIISLIEKGHTIQSVGIGFPGFIDPDSKKIIASPNLPGLSYFNLAAELSRILGLPVTLENDANAAAYGEFILAGKPHGGLIYAGLGTGVGGGLVLNDKIFTGQHGCAMEIGHIIVERPATEASARQCGCGNKGCMEQYASASGIAISYFNKTQQNLTAAQIAKLAGEGDKYAIAAYLLSASALAQALASITKVLDIKNLVIGGGVSGAWPLMKLAFMQRFEADLIPVLRSTIQIKVSNANDKAGMLGAAILSTAE
ncbi:MAG: ROK family protein [Bdellovibrio sp.]|nr:ROK family protein [Methylotenera sp.]